MSVMFEVMYKSPTDARREAVISKRVEHFGGRLTYREEPNLLGIGTVCQTFEFADRGIALESASSLRAEGEHVEGPCEYGDESSEILPVAIR